MLAGLALAVLRASTLADEPIALSYNEQAIAKNCTLAERSAAGQDQCFKDTGLIHDGRTPKQIRAILASSEKAKAAAAEAAVAKSRAAELKAEADAAAAKAECVSHLTADEGGLAANQQIQLGMSRAALLCSWGRPNRINRTVGSWGVHEQFVYGDGHYVYVENGKITSWQD